jgi:hypothetical protein
MYSRRLPLSWNSPAVYRLFCTGTIGGGRKGGLHCPPCVWLERVRPEIIEPDDLQAFDVGNPISQHGDALRLEDLDNPPSDFRVRPIRAVIVVTQDGQGREPALRKVAIDACGVFVDVVVVADEVAGHHDEIGSKLRRPLKRPSQVVVVHRHECR